MEINEKLYKEIKEYCTLNELDVGKYINELLRDAFMKDKYGERPFISIKQNKKADEELRQIVDSVGGDEKYAEIITNLIFDDKPAEEKHEGASYNEDSQEVAPAKVRVERATRMPSKEEYEPKNEERKKSSRRKIEAK